MPQTLKSGEGLQRSLPPVEIIGFCLLILVALVPRLLWINQSPWFDEMLTIAVTDPHQPSLAEGVRVHHDNRHLPLYFYITSCLYTLYPSIALIRLPSVVFDIVKLFIVWRLARRIVPTPVMWLGLLLFAFAPMEVFTAHDARPYSLLTLCTTLAVYGLYIAMREHRRWGWICLFLGAALSIHVSFFGFLSFASLALLAIVWTLQECIRARKLRQHFMPLVYAGGCMLAALLTFAPLLPWLRRWLVQDFGPGSSDFPSATNGLNSQLLYELCSNFGYGLSFFAWTTLAFFLLGLGIALWRFRDLAVTTLCLLAGGMGPFFLLMPFVTVSHFQIRYFLYVQPFVLLCVALGLYTIWRSFMIIYVEGLFSIRMSPRRRDLMSGVLAAMTILSLFRSGLQGTLHPMEIDTAGVGRALSQFHQPGDIVLVEPSYLRKSLWVLAPGLPDVRPARGTNLGELKAQVMKGGNRIWLVSWKTQENIEAMGFTPLNDYYSHWLGLALWEPALESQAKHQSVLEWRRKIIPFLTPSPYMDFLLCQAEYNVGDFEAAEALCNCAAEGLYRQAKVETWRYNGSMRAESAMLYGKVSLARGDKVAALEAFKLARRCKPWDPYYQSLVKEMEAKLTPSPRP